MLPLILKTKTVKLKPQGFESNVSRARLESRELQACVFHNSSFVASHWQDYYYWYTS